MQYSLSETQDGLGMCKPVTSYSQDRTEVALITRARNDSNSSADVECEDTIYVTNSENFVTM